VGGPAVGRQQHGFEERADVVGALSLIRILDVRQSDGHRAIATAIRDRQAAVARAWATAHIAGVETGRATQWPIRTRRRVWRRSRRPKA